MPSFSPTAAPRSPWGSSATRARRTRLYFELDEMRDRTALRTRLHAHPDAVPILRGGFRRTEAVVDTEERLFSFYRAAVTEAEGRELLLLCPAPENEAGELCGIRHLLRDTARFSAVLQALLRASALCRTAAIFPFVTTPQELAAVRRHMMEAMRALLVRGEAFDEGMELGIVVETPAAVMLSRVLAEEVDLLLLNVASLARFALAAAPSADTATLYRDARLAIDRLVETVIGNAHAVGRRVVLLAHEGMAAEARVRWLEMGADGVCLSGKHGAGELHEARRGIHA